MALSPVESYADLAIERWYRERLMQPLAGRPRAHSPLFCGCLTCADGRVVTGFRPLVPYLARRSLPEVAP